jgi:chromosome segregation ATPase
MADITIVIFGILLSITVAAAFEYYKRIRMAHKEYEKARGFIEDVVLSFNRELKRESDRFESMASKVDVSCSTADVSYRKADNLEKRMNAFEGQLCNISQTYQVMTQTFSEDTQKSGTLLSGFKGLETKIRDIETTQETLRIKITSFEEQIQKLSLTPLPQETSNDTVLPPILIKREKALATLTDTEIAVLEMLSEEGAKTAPEIKERVHLSREHTARLMKKLYEEGYLERESGKIPFKYSIKKEMEALLQKADQPPSAY